MKLHVRYGTWTAGGAVHKHPCGKAHKMLLDVGHAPEAQTHPVAAAAQADAGATHWAAPARNLPG